MKGRIFENMLHVWEKSPAVKRKMGYVTQRTLPECQ